MSSPLERILGNNCKPVVASRMSFREEDVDLLLDILRSNPCLLDFKINIVSGSVDDFKVRPDNISDQKRGEFCRIRNELHRKRIEALRPIAQSSSQKVDDLLAMTNDSEIEQMS